MTYTPDRAALPAAADLRRAYCLGLLGWSPCWGGPDAILADAAAEAGLGDAEAIRRGLALGRAAGLLVELAAHEGDGPHGSCPVCGGLLGPHAWRRRRWCPRCREHRLPGPTQAGLAAALAAALREAGDVRAVRLNDRLDTQDVTTLLTARACPGCGWTTPTWTYPRGGGPNRYDCRNNACGWSGPADGLLPPLLSRDELGRRAAALRATRG